MMAIWLTVFLAYEKLISKVVAKYISPFFLVFYVSYVSYL